MTDIVFDSEDREMETVNSLLSQTGSRTEGVYSMSEAVDKIYSTVMITPLDETVPSLGTSTVTDEVSVSPASGEAVTTVSVLPLKLDLTTLSVTT